MEFDMNREIDWGVVWQWTLNIGAALLILLVTHFIAKAVKWAIARLVDRVPLLQRHSSAQPGETVGSQIGTLAYWIVMLVGIVVALQPLQLGGVITPINTLTNEVFGYVPRIIGAGAILFFGFIVANIVRRIVETFLMTVNADGWLARAGAGDLTGSAAAMPA
ncbi:MAG: mechanosensitive ion channel, partial [Sphingomonadaceae bacterium]|nr:mechanosensitive ion channel [Sphingomonadaceae bacterium]